MCTLPRCGDGVLSFGEACDPSVEGGPQCGTRCQLAPDHVWLDQRGADGNSAVVRLRADRDSNVFALVTAVEDGFPVARLRKYSPAGDVQWTTELGNEVCGLDPSSAGVRRFELVVEDHGVYVLVPHCGESSNSGELHRLSVDGTMEWSSVGGYRAIAGRPEGGVVVSVADTSQSPVGYRMAALGSDAASAWEVEAAVGYERLVVSGDTIYGANRTALVAHGPRGEVRWERELRSVGFDLASAPDGGVIVARDAYGVPEVVGPWLEIFDAQGVKRVASPLPFESLRAEARPLGQLAVGSSGLVSIAGIFPAAPHETYIDDKAATLVYDLRGVRRGAWVHDGPGHGIDVAHATIVRPDGVVMGAGAQAVALNGYDSWVAAYASHRMAVQIVPALPPTSVPSPRSTAPEPLERVGARPDTIFLNFKGGLLQPGGTNGGRNEVACIDAPVNYPAFLGSGNDAAHIARAVRTWVSDLDVRVVTTRPPPYLTYTTVMIGGRPSALNLSDSVRGYACDVDCGDRRRGDVAFVFSDTAPSNEEIARTTVHEVAHLWGLEHVDAVDLMNAIAFQSEPSLVDACVPLHSGEPSRCGANHALWCPDGQQNVKRELQAVVGLRPSEADEPPTVNIVEPVQGGEYPAGVPVWVSVEVDDDKPLFGWGFSVPGLNWSFAALDDEMELELYFPPGVHELEVEATDQAGNVARRSVSFTVSGPKIAAAY